MPATHLRIAGLRTVLTALGAAFVTVVALAASAVFRFGSVAHAAAYARGERVIVEPVAVDLGDVAPHAAISYPVTVTNLSGRPVCTLGGNLDCACWVRERMPLTVPAGGAVTLHLEFVLRPCAADGKFDYLLYTDVRDRPLRVSAVWRPIDQPAALAEPEHAGVLRECADGQRKIEALYRHARARGTRVERNAYQNPPLERHLDFAFAANGDSQRYTEVVTKTSFNDGDCGVGYARAWVATADLCFLLDRRQGQAGYRATWLGRRAFDKGCAAVDDKLLNYSQTLRCPYRLGGLIPLAILVGHPTFVPKKVTRAETAGVPVVAIDFEATPGSGPDDNLRTWRNCGRLTGSFTCVPGLSWAVSQFQFIYLETVNNEHLEIKGVVQYAAGTGVPRPQRIERVIASGGIPGDVIIWDVAEFEDRPGDPAEFTPAAFGLTDPVPPPAGRPFLWWLAAGAVAALLATAGLRAPARRRAAA